MTSNKKKIKKPIIVAACVVGAIGIIIGVLFLINSLNKKPVPVYSLLLLGQTSDSFGYSKEISGSVYSDNFQKVYLSSSQTIKDVYVTQGQNVTENTPLLAYDTTLSQLEVSKSEVALDKKKLELTKAENTLNDLYNTKTTETLDKEIEELEAALEKAIESTPGGKSVLPELPYQKDEDGPWYIEDPGSLDLTEIFQTYGPEVDIVLVTVEGEGDDVKYTNYKGMHIYYKEEEQPEGSGDFLGGWTVENSWETAPEDVKKAFNAAVERYSDITEFKPVSYMGSRISNGTDYMVLCKLTDAETEETGYAMVTVNCPPGGDDTLDDSQIINVSNFRIEDEVTDYVTNAYIETFEAEELEPSDPVETDEIKNLKKQLEEKMEEELESSTEEEKAAAIDAQIKNINNLQLQVRIAEVSLKSKQSELTDGIVYSKITGTVTVVRTAEEVKNDNTPLIEIDGGEGGYYIIGNLPETELDLVYVGMEVDVNCPDTGEYWEGEVVEISHIPESSSEKTSFSTGANISYYPVKVFVDKSANINENSYITISYVSSEEDDSIYVPKMIVREEGGQSYVYKRGDNDLLTKQYVKTGKELYGSYVEIKDGLTMMDYVAFPYGSDVEEGAKTTEGDLSEFYSY